jgi:hypothetical protein
MKAVTRLVASAAAASYLLGMLISPASSALRGGVIASPVEAGYQATDSTPIKTFTGTITIPALRCPAAGMRNINAEVQLTDNSGDFAALGWNATCDKGTVGLSSAEAWMSTPQGSKHTTASGNTSVAPGQTLRFAMTVSPLGVSGSVKNVATGASGSLSFPMTKPPSFKRIGAQLQFANPSSPGGNVSPIPSFTKVTFSNLRFNGATLATLSPTEFEEYNGTTLQVATGPISASGTFTTIFKHV